MCLCDEKCICNDRSRWFKMLISSWLKRRDDFEYCCGISRRSKVKELTIGTGSLPCCLPDINAWLYFDITFNWRMDSEAASCASYVTSCRSCVLCVCVSSILIFWVQYMSDWDLSNLSSPHYPLAGHTTHRPVLSQTQPDHHITQIFSY